MKNNILTPFLFVMLFGIISGSTFVNDDCDELRKENERLKIELGKMQKIAEEQRAMADAANVEAVRQAKIAAENAANALRQAESARREAQLAQIEIDKQKNIAELNAREAQRQAEAAQSQAAEAERQRKLAEECEKKK